MSEHSDPSNVEAAYVAAMSRNQVVDAYSSWFELTVIEQICIDIVVTEGLRVLDLGCGAGRFVKAVTLRSSEYLGVDVSAEMLDAARKSFPQTTFVQADILDYSPTGDWNVILLMGNVLDCLHPIDRRKKMLTNCYEWLRSRGGTVIGSSHLAKPGSNRGYYIEDYHGSEIQNYRSSLSEMMDELNRFGFVVDLIARDYRDSEHADWSYWIARVIPASDTLA